MLVREQIERELPNFIGTEQWHRWSALFPRYTLTDGAKFVADSCGAYWLMDIIASWQCEPKVRREPFQVWTLTVQEQKGKRMGLVIATDGDEHRIARQVIEYTDFPLPYIKLYFEEGVILLPSEH